MRLAQQAAVLIAVQANLPPFMWGPPGQGKSQFVRGGFSKLGYLVRVLRVNTILPHQLSGTQIPNPTGDGIITVPPDWVLDLNAADKSVLLLDDVSCASTMGQTATMGLMDEREIGGVKLEAVPIAAANPNSMATARFEIDAAAANRCVHIPITADPEAFRDAARADFPAPQVPQLRDNWERLIPGKRKLITNFLCSTEGSAVINREPDNMTSETVAWPSERSWTHCWTLMAACDAIIPESMKGIDIREVRTLLMQGCVGKGAMGKFHRYFLTPMQANVDEALKHGTAYSFPESGDEIFGLLSAVSKKFAGATISKKNWNLAWKLLEGVWQTQYQDVGLTFAIDLLSLNDDRHELPPFYEKAVLPALASNS